MIPHRLLCDLTEPPGQFFFSGDRSPAWPDRGGRKNVAPLCTESNWDAAYSVFKAPPLRSGEKLRETFAAVSEKFPSLRSGDGFRQNWRVEIRKIFSSLLSGDEFQTTLTVFLKNLSLISGGVAAVVLTDIFEKIPLT